MVRPPPAAHRLPLEHAQPGRRLARVEDARAVPATSARSARWASRRRTAQEVEGDPLGGEDRGTLPPSSATSPPPRATCPLSACALDQRSVGSTRWRRPPPRRSPAITPGAFCVIGARSDGVLGGTSNFCCDVALPDVLRQRPGRSAPAWGARGYYRAGGCRPAATGPHHRTSQADGHSAHCGTFGARGTRSARTGLGVPVYSLT